MRGIAHTAVFKAEMVRCKAAGSVILQGWICRSPSCTYRRRSTGLVSRYLSSAKKSAEGSAVMADMGLKGNNPPKALLKISRPFRMQDPLVQLQAKKKKIMPDVFLNSPLKKNATQTAKGEHRSPQPPSPDPPAPSRQLGT